MGDRNSVRTKSERKGGIFDGRDAKYFNSFIAKANLVEVPLLRRKFTWHGPMGKKSKLDSQGTALKVSPVSIYDLSSLKVVCSRYKMLVLSMPHSKTKFLPKYSSLVSIT